MPATGPVETLRSFVNTWECDENNHLNVQFYLKRFDEAARHFALSAPGGRHDGPLPVDRHVRYHGELRAGSAVHVESAAIADGEMAGRVAHFLRNSETGALSATALDAADGLDHSTRIAAADAVPALPRSVGAEPLAPIPADAVLSRGGFVSHRAIVRPADCDAAGEMTEQHYVARVSDGAAHTWAHGGIRPEWLLKNGLGRVAVEMKITRHRPARAGDALELCSMISRAGERTVRLRHEIVRRPDRTAVASVEMIALLIDLKTRRAVSLPATIG